MRWLGIIDVLVCLDSAGLFASPGRNHEWIADQDSTCASHEEVGRKKIP